MTKRTEGEVVDSDTQNRVNSTGHHVTQHFCTLRFRELGRARRATYVEMKSYVLSKPTDGPLTQYEQRDHTRRRDGLLVI